jgi:hypothetical protein
LVGAAIAAGLGIAAGVGTVVCCYRPPAKDS